MTLRPVRLLGIGLAAVLLAGCTSNFLGDGGDVAGAEPSPTEAAATPEQTPAPDVAEPQPDEPDCVSLLIDRPGNYVIGECASVTLEGTGIRLAFSSIAELIVRGDGADLIGESLGSVQIDGQGATISALDIADLMLRGNDNVVTAETTIGTVNVQGNGNVVSAGDGIEPPFVDNGLNNEIG